MESAYDRHTPTPEPMRRWPERCEATVCSGHTLAFVVEMFRTLDDTPRERKTHVLQRTFTSHLPVPMEAANAAF